MTRIILPKLEQEEIRIFTLEEQKAFIEALPDNTSGRALYFILGTGLRLAELTGLRWSDIHENEFHISQTIRRNRNFDENDPRKTSLQTSSPKTKAGRRTIPMPPKLKEVLLSLHIEYDTEQSIQLRLFLEELSNIVRNKEIGKQIQCRQDDDLMKVDLQM